VLTRGHVDPDRYCTPQSGSEDQQTIGEISLTPWQLRKVQSAIEQLEEERFAEGERTMSEAERPDLYEPAGYVAKEPIEPQSLVDQLATVVASA
jgi:hypothetical protein